jgi:hypothetical protein
MVHQAWGASLGLGDGGSLTTQETLGAPRRLTGPLAWKKIWKSTGWTSSLVESLLKAQTDPSRALILNIWILITMLKTASGV